jgi:hypothetical protein
LEMSRENSTKEDSQSPKSIDVVKQIEKIPHGVHQRKLKTK